MQTKMAGKANSAHTPSGDWDEHTCVHRDHGPFSRGGRGCWIGPACTVVLLLLTFYSLWFTVSMRPHWSFIGEDAFNSLFPQILFEDQGMLLRVDSISHYLFMWSLHSPRRWQCPPLTPAALPSDVSHRTPCDVLWLCLRSRTAEWFRAQV